MFLALFFFWVHRRASATAIMQRIEYASLDASAQRLDLLRPAACDAAPLLVWIHGGGWRTGRDGAVPEQILGMVSLGYAVAAVGYRYSQDAAFPAQLQDVRAAIRHLRHGAAAYGLNASAIVVAGFSAGAHLAALLAVTHASSFSSRLDLNASAHLPREAAEASSAIRAAVAFSAPTDLVAFRRDFEQQRRCGGTCCDAVSALLGGCADLPTDCLEEAEFASPVHHANATATTRPAPLFLAAQDVDCLVPSAQSQRLHAVLQQRWGDDESFALVVNPERHHNAVEYTDPAVWRAWLERHVAPRCQPVVEGVARPVRQEHAVSFSFWLSVSLVPLSALAVVLLVVRMRFQQKR